MEIKKELWATTPDGKEIFKYTMTNEKGASAVLSNLGAAIISVIVPDKDGNLVDVVLGYEDPMSYFGDGPCLGKCPGRFANRIAVGKFTLDGKEYTLPINNGPNHLHGGPEGFQNKVWESRIDGNKVEFLYFSEDGEQGYPGNMKVIACYQWDDDNELTLTFTAETDAPTIVNLTNHAYFNLNGEGSGDVLGHELTLNCSEYLPTDDTLIPLGESEPVAGTPMDFVSPKLIGKEIKADFAPLNYGKGYDNCWIIDGHEEGQLQEVGELYSEKTGISMKVTSTQPGVQVYTGNWLGGCPAGKNGHTYNDYDGVAIECQHYPDAPNQPEYPSVVLRPGEVHEQAIVFAFSVR